MVVPWQSLLSPVRQPGPLTYCQPDKPAFSYLLQVTTLGVSGKWCRCLGEVGLPLCCKGVVWRKINSAGVIRVSRVKLLVLPYYTRARRTMSATLMKYSCEASWGCIIYGTGIIILKLANSQLFSFAQSLVEGSGFGRGQVSAGAYTASAYTWAGWADGNRYWFNCTLRVEASCPQQL